MGFHVAMRGWVNVGSIQGGGQWGGAAWTGLEGAASGLGAVRFCADSEPSIGIRPNRYHMGHHRF